jgi:hypothetical protein
MAEVSCAYATSRNHYSTKGRAMWLRRVLAAVRRVLAAIQRHRQELRQARKYFNSDLLRDGF